MVGSFLVLLAGIMAVILLGSYGFAWISKFKKDNEL